jgi:hypothetical protein
MLQIVEFLDAPFALTRSYTPGNVSVEVFNKLSIEDINKLPVEDKYIYHYFLHDSPVVDKKKIDKCKVELNGFNKLSILDRLMAYNHGERKIPFDDFGESIWVCKNHIYAPYYYHTDNPIIQLGLCRWNGVPEAIKLVPIEYIKQIPVFAFKRIPLEFYEAMTDKQIKSLKPALKDMLDLMKDLDDDRKKYNIKY